MNIFLAIILGVLFGFILQKVGAANPKKIIDMLRLKDFHLMKAILMGIGISSVLLFFTLAFGIINSAHISVKASYIGVIIGGGVLGLGWAISGFCPGTGVVAAGAGRKDALFFVVGGLAGALLFALVYASLLSKTPFLFKELGGKATLAETGVKGYTTLLPSIPAIIVAGVIAALFIAIPWFLPDNQNVIQDKTQADG